MRLDRITVQNFKSIPPAGISIFIRRGIAVLVGRNNAGKSNILEAVKLVASAKNPRYQRYDRAWFQDATLPLTVEIEFSGADYGDGKRLGLSEPQCRQLVGSSRRGPPDPKSGHIILRLEARPAQDEEQSADDADEAEAEAKTSVVIVLGSDHVVLRTEPIRKLLVRTVAVPALRDHKELLAASVWTSYGQMVRDILGGSEKVDQLRKLIEEASASLQAVLADEAASITSAARATAFVDRVDFRLTKDGDPLELLRNLSLSVSFAGRTDDISAVGTGTQSAIILGILELCLRHKATFGVRLFLVEEPELHLHPHAQRHLGRLLRAVAEQEGSYVLLTTHSSEIAMGMGIDSVVRVDRDSQTGHTRVQQVPEDHSEAAASRVLNASTADMLFSDRAVLVEGVSEAVFLPAVARLVRSQECDFDKLNVSVVDVTGKGSFGRFTGFLDHLGIPWRVVADLDALQGSDLKRFREQAGVTAEMGEEEAIRRLRAVNVCVLRFGEIEDYYPRSALAELGECSEADVDARLAEASHSVDDLSVPDVVSEMVVSHREDVASLPEHRLRKAMPGWYSQAVAALRNSAQRVPLKTGNALSRWLGKPKPSIAQAAAAHLHESPDKMPERLRLLLLWLAQEDSPQVAQVDGEEPR